MKVNKVRFWMMYHMNMNVIVKRVNSDDKTTERQLRLWMLLLKEMCTQFYLTVKLKY